MQKILRKDQTKHTIIALFFIIITIWLAQVVVLAKTITIAWDYDFTTSGDVVKFNVYQSNISGQYELGLDYAIKSIDSNKDNPVLTTNIDVPVGTWYYVVTASDANENVSDASNEIFYTVEPPDTTPPVFAAFSDIIVDATDQNGTIVQFEITATDDSGQEPLIGCTPESGSQLPIGTTVVECTATDAAGNIATGSFNIIVNDVVPPEPPTNLRYLLSQAISILQEVMAQLPTEPLQTISIVSPDGYQTAILKDGDRYYLDRVYTLVSIPSEFANATWIVPRNDDKASLIDDFLQFDLTNPATVFIAYDSRAITRPNWLADFTLTDLKIDVSDEVGHFVVLKKEFAPGHIVLGGNKAVGSEFPTPEGGTNYLVIIIG